MFFDRTCVEQVGNHLVALGCSTEYLKAHNLLAVNIPETVKLTDVQAYLQKKINSGRVDREEPILRQ